MIEIRVPGIPPGGNALHRMTHWQVKRSREEWREKAYWSAVQARVGADWTPPLQAVASIEWRFRLRRRRDYDNLLSGLKPILDALVAAGIITDDDTEHLAFGELHVSTGADEDETVIRIPRP